MTKKKPELWRIAAGIAGIAAILLMWAQRDVPDQYASMDAASLLPLLAVNLVVTLAKAALIAGLVLAVKWLIGKFRQK